MRIEPAKASSCPYTRYNFFLVALQETWPLLFLDNRNPLRISLALGDTFPLEKWHISQFTSFFSAFLPSLRPLLIEMVSKNHCCQTCRPILTLAIPYGIEAWFCSPHPHPDTQTWNFVVFLFLVHYLKEHSMILSLVFIISWYSLSNLFETLYFFFKVSYITISTSS